MPDAKQDWPLPQPFDSALFALRPRGARFVLFHLPAEYASFSECGMRF